MRAVSTDWYPEARIRPWTPEVKLQGDETFEVCSNGVVLHTSPTFLDAADLAFDLVEREEPGTVEIVQVLGEQRQRIWSCARPRAELGSSASTWGTGWPLARHGKGVA